MDELSTNRLTFVSGSAYYSTLSYNYNNVASNKAETLLREARKARTQARVRSQEEGVYSRLNSSTGPASESNHSDVPASSAPASAPASEVDEREDSLVIEEKPSLSDAGEEAADSAVDDNRHGAFLLSNWSIRLFGPSVVAPLTNQDAEVRVVTHAVYSVIGLS